MEVWKQQHARGYFAAHQLHQLPKIADSGLYSVGMDAGNHQWKHQNGHVYAGGIEEHVTQHVNARHCHHGLGFSPASCRRRENVERNFYFNAIMHEADLEWKNALRIQKKI